MNDIKKLHSSSYEKEQGAIGFQSSAKNYGLIQVSEKLNIHQRS